MVCPSLVAVFVEGDIEHPMQFIFHLPVRASPMHRSLSVHWKGAEEVPVFHAADTDSE